MKEWEELEDNFLKEIQPLIDEFFEYKKPNIEDKQERERLYRIRRDIRKTVESRVKPFVSRYREMVTRNIETLKGENIELKNSFDEKIKNLQPIQVKIQKIRKAKEQTKAEKDETTYDLLCLTEIEEKQKFEKMRHECNIQIRRYNSNVKEIKKLGEMLQEEFKMKYGDMDIISENDMGRLDTVINDKEEKDMGIIQNKQLFDNTKSVEDVANEQRQAEEKREQRKEQEKKQRIEAKDRELIEIQKEIAQDVLDQKRQEFEEYLDQKMKELEENIDEELKEMQETNIRDDEDNNKKNNKGSPKKDKITLWQKFKSIFRQRNIPLLGEAKKQVTQYGNKFKKDIKLGVPTLIQQANNTKEIIGKNEEKSSEDEKIAELYDILLS